jgi:hypothetical protein
MKQNIVVSFLITVALVASSAMAESTKVFTCKGSERNNFYTLEIYQGDYGYEAEFVLKINQETSNIVATGQAYSECGSRNFPCEMIQIAQYSSTTPKMIFTMVSKADSKSGSGTLAFYDGTFSEQTHEVTLLCEK